MAKFQKGESGNPGGRPKMPEELKAAMRGLADTAVKVLREAMEGDDPRARILAANTVLDRGYGKATQPIIAEGIDAGAAHLTALQELTAKRAAPEPVKPATPVALADDGEKPPASRIN
jgi:hypothetical protein